MYYRINKKKPRHERFFVWFITAQMQSEAKSFAGSMEVKEWKMLS